MRPHALTLPLAFATLFTLTACATAPNGQTVPYQPLATVNTADGLPLTINHGGFGSDAAAHPHTPNQFYALTDRGPNLDTKGAHGAGKIFPTPDFTPSIGLFAIGPDQSITLLKTIPLKNRHGEPISGLPNPPGMGGTLEVPYRLDNRVITVDPNRPYDPNTNPIRWDEHGLDSEGLAALKDGTFWVSDEYGPHMVHFDANGVEIGRINPFSQDVRAEFNLPAEWANRRPNRGMEGLTISPDQTTLVGIMQSALANPNKAAQKSDLTRLVSVDLKTGQTKQYLYPQAIAENSNSGIMALANGQFLVIERDGKFALKKPEAMKHVYQIDLSLATDLNAIPAGGAFSHDPQLGLLINGQTLEQYRLSHDWADLALLGIRPAQKTLVADLVQSLNYPHDKFEGLWLLNADTLAVINDDDFSIWTTDNQPEPKYLDPERRRIDHNTVYTLPFKPHA
ncbi:MAG: esterase-like activity of phytase family protein [Neisseriaceae bacterium]|nr:esterase-like activity of phytase family protein [Neisseriaceae bacterium]MBP6863430.1 esterase-like activity of phytase family protein [Neisseriaceae bacterium]